METADPYVLEERLLALGIRSRTGPSSRSTSSPRAAPGPAGDVDFFGIGVSKAGGPDAKLPFGDAGGDLGQEEPDPAEALAGAEGP